ncbi:10254_t:CDS:2 [Cetraspora pellucida]|uniref:10254_t:CDS:1 n=1 Tax=Cetraspora pellucida TaxID=1433469 RepID=A0A9N9CZ70_9GLOM|nr:10254_t:CDS:2 [Cetraspora pellucida]
MQRSKHNAHTPTRTPSDNVSQRVNSNNPSNNTNSVTNANSNGSVVDNRDSQQQKGLEWMLGLSIRVKTSTDDEYEGTNSGGSQKYDFRILKINFLKDVTQLHNRKSSVDINANINSSTTNSSQQTNVGYVQMDRIQAKELQSIKDTQVALAKIGVGVTQEAQDIFDAMSKTLPCRWHKESIIVLDEVIINPPYDIENCKANLGSTELLARVRKVKERKEDWQAGAEMQMAGLARLTAYVN